MNLSKVDILNTTSAQLRELKANQLDQEWAKRYPDGMYYAIWYKDKFSEQGESDMGIHIGRQLKRPTSRTHHQDIYSDSYNVLRYCTKKVLRMSRREELYSLVESLGIDKHPYILFLKTGDVLTGKFDGKGKELRAYDTIEVIPRGLCLLKFNRKTNSYGFWDEKTWEEDTTLGEYKRSKYPEEFVSRYKAHAKEITGRN